jgi:hypothetical protein
MTVGSMVMYYSSHDIPDMFLVIIMKLLWVKYK